MKELAGKEAGRCVMPEEGVFAGVVKGGTVRADDDLSMVLPAD
jgi:MOSC domain-containing protein YiiM